MNDAQKDFIVPDYNAEKRKVNVLILDYQKKLTRYHEDATLIFRKYNWNGFSEFKLNVELCNNQPTCELCR